MSKIKSMNTYQRIIIILMLAMSIAFAVIYPVTIHRVGFAYGDAILTPSYDNGSIIYSGKIKGQQACFTVSADKTVVFRYGDKSYGPYTARTDPTAIPRDDKELAEHMTGVELREGDSVIFRGGVFDAGDGYWLFNEDGSLDNIGIFYETDDGVRRDANGNAVDTMRPSAESILTLMNEPELRHKGNGLAWLAGAFICLINAGSIVFADELFRWSLSFQIRNADRAEPSDWEIAGRYTSWTIMTVFALITFILGLK